MDHENSFYTRHIQAHSISGNQHAFQVAHMMVWSKSTRLLPESRVVVFMNLGAPNRRNDPIRMEATNPGCSRINGLLCGSQMNPSIPVLGGSWM